MSTNKLFATTGGLTALSAIFLTVTAAPIAVAQNDVFEHALNYVFLGNIDSSEQINVSILNRDSCIVQFERFKFKVNYFLKNISHSTITLKTEFNSRNEPFPAYWWQIEGDKPVSETLGTTKTTSKIASIRILGNVERTQNAVQLILSKYCPPEKTVPF